MWDVIPGICYELIEWGFAESNEQSEEYKGIKNEMNIKTLSLLEK